MDSWDGYIYNMPVTPSVKTQVPDYNHLTELHVDWKEEQLSDPVLQKVIHANEADDVKQLDAEGQSFRRQWNNLVVVNGILYHGKANHDKRLVLPDDWGEEVIQLVHNQRGHIGRDRTVS